jgi:hypothetical protein
MAEKPKKLQAPVLMAFLREQPVHPSFSPSWAPLAGWIIFAVSALFLEVRLDAALYGLMGAAALGFLTTGFVRYSVKPRDRQQRLEDENCRIVRVLKEKGDEGQLYKSVPPSVLTALEQAATVRASIVTKLSANDPHAVEHSMEQLDEALVACLRASKPVIRRDDLSRREWEALLENGAMIGATVDAITAQTLRMQNEIDPSQERSQALHELDSASYITPPDPVNEVVS